MPKEIRLDITLKCGKYSTENYQNKNIKEVKQIIESFFKTHLDYDYNISYNVLTNIIKGSRPINPLLKQFINIKKSNAVEI